MSHKAGDGPNKEIHPLTAIAIVIAISAAAFAGELAVADDLPWGEEARGVTRCARDRSRAKYCWVRSRRYG